MRGITDAVVSSEGHGAARVFRRARDRQRSLRAALGHDDSPEQHAEDVWQSSHETADRRLVEVLTGEAPSAIHWLEELGVEFTRENGGYPLGEAGGRSRRNPPSRG